MNYEIQYSVRFQPIFDGDVDKTLLASYFSLQEIFVAAARVFPTAQVLEMEAIDLEFFNIELNLQQISLISEEVLRKNVNLAADCSLVKQMVDVPINIFSDFCKVCCEVEDADSPNKVVCRLGLDSKSLLEGWLSQNCPEKIEQISSNSIDWLKRRFKLVSMDDLIYVKFSEDGLRIAQERCDVEDATDDDGVTEMSLKDLFENFGDVLSQNSFDIFEGGGIFISDKNLIKNVCET